MARWHRAAALGTMAALVALTLAAGCRQDMHDQPKYKPYAESDFFADGQSARLPVKGTVPIGGLHEDRVLTTGIDAAGTFVADLPVPLTRGLLDRGREQYGVFCAPCHGLTGDGKGMIVQRGFKPPSSYHIDRLRAQPIGYFFDVMTNGFGQMSSYAGQVPADDRWAIAAYIRALQLSQHATPADLGPEDREALERAKHPKEESPAGESSHGAPAHGGGA